MSTTDATLQSELRDASPERLDFSLRLGWAMGSLGTATLLNGISFMVLFYLSGILGIEPAVAGALMFASKLYDMATDPVMGWVSDRTRTRFGRRRPWLLVGAVLCPLSMVMLFTNTGLTGDALLVYVTFALVLYATGYTIFNVPYIAMPAEMTGQPYERSRLMSLRVVFIMVGTLFGTALAPALIDAFGSEAPAYEKTGWTLAAIIFVAMVWAFLGTGRARSTERSLDEPPLLEQVKSALGNRPYCLLVGSKFAQLFGIASSTGSSLFLIKIVLERPESDLAGFGLAVTAGTILSMPAWLRTSGTIGKRNTYFIGVALFVLAKLSWLLATTDEPQTIFLARGLLSGIAAGGILLIAQSMLPDTIEHDFHRTGLRREGALAAMYSFVEKTAFAFGPLVFGVILSVFGFEAGSPDRQSPEALAGIMLGVVWVPVIASITSALILVPYRLELAGKEAT